MFHRSTPDGFLLSGQGDNEVQLENLDLSPSTEVNTSEHNVLTVTKAEESTTMSSGEDEPSASLNGRLRPRKSTSTSTPSPLNKNIRKRERKIAYDRPKRTSTPSKASPAKQDDLNKRQQSDAAQAPLFLCPYCDRKFNVRQTASKHARRIHLSTSKQDNFIKCLYCNHSDAESHTIIKHMVDSHPNQYFACLHCHTRFLSTTELAEHKHTVCEKQKTPYRSKLRQKTSPGVKPKKSNNGEKTKSSNENTQLTNDLGFNRIVISCELKPTDMRDDVDIEDKITTNLILPSSKTLGNTGVEKNAVIVLDDLQWNKRIPPNFNFHNSDADQILSRLGVVHRSPKVGESRKDLVKMMDEPNEKFERCFDTNFYSKVAKNVQENLAICLDGTFNFNPNKDTTIKTRKSKASAVINTAEGFPILLGHEQFSRNLFDGLIPRAIAPKHKWKWDSTENDKNLLMLLDQTKRDSRHVNNCIVTLMSSLDIWTQLRMKSKFEEMFKPSLAAKKMEKQNVIGMELKEILESRDIPSSSTQVVQYKKKPVKETAGSELPAYLGLSATSSKRELQPAVLSGEWVRPRCYVCCACGDQTRDARTLSAHLTTQHPNAQVQHYEIVGDTLLSADILKHLYVPPSQMSNRTRPARGFRDCTKCKNSVTLEDLHQHMLDCAGDTPTVRRKCRYRPFGVRKRRPRLPDNTVRKKIRKDVGSRHAQKSHKMRPRTKTRTEVGDAETIRKMIADLPAKRNRITPTSILRPRRTVLKTKKKILLRSSDEKRSKLHVKPKKTEVANNQADTDNSSTEDEDNQPLKLSATRVSTRTGNGKQVLRRRATINKTKKKKQSYKQEANNGFPPNYSNTPGLRRFQYTFNQYDLGQNVLLFDMSRRNILRPTPIHPYSLDIIQYGRNFCFRPWENGLIYPVIQGFPQSVLDPELAVREPHYPSVLDIWHHRIDVNSAVPCKIHQHGSRDDNNMQGSRDRTVERADGCNQNSNIAQAPNRPLKHSIASLTSNYESYAASGSYEYNYLLPSESNASIVHRSVGGRNEFEKEETVEKVDKPPLSIQFGKSDKQQLLSNIPKEDCKLSALTQVSCDLITSRNLTVPLLPNELVQCRATSEQILIKKEKSGLLECAPQMPLLDKKNTLELVGQTSSKLKDSRDLAGLNQEHKIAHSNAERLFKTETDKTKSSKTRKGLNDCIAMLRTKKGLRLDKVCSEHGGGEDMNSKIIDFETVNSEVPSTVSSEPSLSVSETTEEITKKSVNVLPNLPFTGQDGSNLLPAQTNNIIRLRKNTLINKELAWLNPKRHKSEVGVTKFSCNQILSIKSRERRGLCIYRDNLNKMVFNKIDFKNPILTSAVYDAMTRAVHGNPRKGDKRRLYKYNQRIAAELEREKTPQSTLMQDQCNVELVEKSEQVVSTTTRIAATTAQEIATTAQIAATTSQVIATTVQVAVTTAQIAVTTSQEVETTAQAISQIVLSTEYLIDTKTPSTHNNVSPSPKRTRRKPNKEKLEKHPEFNRELSKPQLPTMMSILHHNSGEIGISTVDSTMSNNASGLLAVSPSHEILPLKTPPPLLNSSCVQQDPRKQVLNISATSDVVANEEKASLSEVARTTPEMRAGNNMTLYNSLHSIELANAASIEQYESTKVHNKDDKSPLSLQQTRQTNLDECLNAKADYDKFIYDFHSRYPPHSTLVSMTHNTPGAMHVNPKAVSSNLNVSSTHEPIDNYSKRYENKQFMSVRKQRYDNLEAKREYSKKIGEHIDKYSNQENEAIKHKPSTLDTNSHRFAAHRIPEVYNTRSASFPSNVPNVKMLDRSLHKEFNENIETRENALRAYNASFLAHTATCSNDVMQNNAISLITPLSCDPNMEEMAPLDLSCDPKTRLDQTLNLAKKSSDVTKIACNVPISNDKNSDNLSINMNMRCNYIEQLRPQHPQLAAQSAPIEELVQQYSPNMLLWKSGKNKDTEMPTEKFANQQKFTASTAQSANVTNSEFFDKSLNSSSNNFTHEIEKNKIITTGNANNYSINQLQCLPPDSNCLVGNDWQLLDSQRIYQESKQVKTILDNKNTRSAAQLKLEDETPKHITPCTPTNVVKNNVEKNNPYGSYHYKSPPNISTSNVTQTKTMNTQNNAIVDIKSGDTDTQTSNHEILPKNDYTEMEQDPETARKIALLPEEIVKILGTIPTDHRNQLLNILPQYVTIPLSNVENVTNNISSSTEVQKKELRTEISHNTSACSDMNKLSANTAISSSSVIPKKRHSPPKSRGRINSSESQSTGAVLPPFFTPALSLRSPRELSESGNNFKRYQTDCSIEQTRGSDTTVLQPTHDTLDLSRTDIELNNLCESAHMNKDTKEADASPALPVQDLNLKLPKKQNPSSEQTASLRAVRIKTTSTKKVFVDNKSVPGKYGYMTNVIVDKSCSNSRQSIDSAHQADIHTTDMTHTIALRDTMRQNTDCFQDRKSEDLATAAFIDMQEERNDNFTHSVPHYIGVSQNESNIIAHDTPQNSDQTKDKDKILLKRSPVPFQDNNTNVDIFLEYINPINFSESIMPEDDLRPEMVSTNIETNKSSVTNNSTQFDTKKNVLTAEINRNVSEEAINTTENRTEDKKTQLLATNQIENNDIKQQKAAKGESCNKISASSLERKIIYKEVSTNNKKSNEDDSEDDIALAVIKQKHGKKHNNNNNKKTSALKQKGFKSKEKRKHQKVSKRQKKKLSENTGIIQKNIFNDVASNNVSIESGSTTELKGDKSKSYDNMFHIISLKDKVNELEVSKESNIIKNMNESKESDENPILEPNETQNILKNSVNINERKETTNFNKDNNYLKQDKSAREQMSDLPDVSRDKTYISSEETQSKEDNICYNKNASKISPSNDQDNEFNLVSVVDNMTKQLEKEIKKCTIETPIVNIQSDLQLCSEISEVTANTLPLRRSRRGKSMYADCSYLEDIEQFEDHIKKTPLTMKRLILSRVEKDKKRISESSILEKSYDVTNDNLLFTSEKSETPAKKEKLTKRKKSPHSKQISKKIKQTGACEHENDISNLSNVHSSLQNNSCILRGLPNAENKTVNDTCKNDFKFAVNTSCLSENTSIVSNEKELNMAGENVIQIKETTASVKRRLNATKMSDIVLSKPKKTKCNKKKSQLDFDSADDEVLLKTIPKTTTESHLVDGLDKSSIPKESNKDGKASKCNESSNDILAHALSTNETRVTCYSRSISNRRPRSSLTPLKDHVNYDPYDIDFIDMLETGPILKKKIKKASDKSEELHHIHKLDVTRKDLNDFPIQELKRMVNPIKPNTTNMESDSDSSKSDVPLQKYVHEKTSKVEIKNKMRDALASNIKCLELKQNLNTDNRDYNKDENTSSNHSNAEAMPTACKMTKSAKRVTIVDSVCESDTPLKDDSPNTNVGNNNITVDQNTQNRLNKRNKTCRTQAVHNVNSDSLHNKDVQQLRSDKFMENFGFYSERIPRKSNLLASKKISETYHMICNESDDSLLVYTEKSSRKSTPNESKKKSESGSNIISSQDSRTIINDVQLNEPTIDSYPNEPSDVVTLEDSDLDSLTAQAIMDSDEVKRLENDLFSTLREAAAANAARNCAAGYQNTSDVDTTAKHTAHDNSMTQIQDKMVENPMSTKKKNKTKQKKESGVQDIMYPQIDEIDMMEDKFDKIKRKRRSQAVAAKQVQIVAETNTSAKSRKQTEKKRTTKKAKKNVQSTQVPTKGALKGFETIKISIPTQDLNMPINLSPPKQKKRRKTSAKQRKKTLRSDSSCNESDDKDKTSLERDIYEFKDSEDTELFDLRPSTVMDRFRSMHSKNTFKHKDRAIDMERDKISSKEKEAKVGANGSTSFRTVKDWDNNSTNYNKKGRKKCISREGRGIEDNVQQENECSEENLAQNFCKKKRSTTPSDKKDDNSNREANNAIASTSSFIPSQINESDNESEISSHGRDLIFYMSDDIDCICRSDMDSDDEVQKGCGKSQCVYRIKNARKNAAIENIFKNNARRCEKTDLKESDKPRPNLDQLFDSLLETESKSNNNDIINISTSLSVAQHNLTESKGFKSLLNKNDISVFDERYNTTHIPQSTNCQYESKNIRTDENTSSKSDYTSSLCPNEILTDSGSMQIFSIDDKPKENLGYTLMSEESTQVNYTDILAHNSETYDETSNNHFKNIKARTTVASNQLTNYNSEDEFDIDKPETLNRQYMHLILPAEKASTYVQTENEVDDFNAESGNESAATKYVKGLSPAEAANLEIYTMVSTQSTQTPNWKKYDSDYSSLVTVNIKDEIDLPLVPRSRIRLQKYDFLGVAQKSKSTKSIQTDHNVNHDSFEYDDQVESSDDVETEKCGKEPDLVKTNVRCSTIVLQEYNDATLAEAVDAFTAPTSRPTAEKHSTRKSDEGISTSHDYSADALEQAYDNAGVARQRARRKCAVGKQNVLAEHWSSESEFDGAPPRPNSADSVVAGASRKKKSRKKEGHHSSGRKASRHLSKSKRAKRRLSVDNDMRAAGGSGASGSVSTGARAPLGPKIRARPTHHYSSSEGEESAGAQPQHGWIVGVSHKKLVTMLAHAKGRKRNTDKSFD